MDVHSLDCSRNLVLHSAEDNLLKCLIILHTKAFREMVIFEVRLPQGNRRQDEARLRSRYIGVLARFAVHTLINLNPDPDEY